jgi:hypothetical protein
MSDKRGEVLEPDSQLLELGDSRPQRGRLAFERGWRAPGGVRVVDLLLVTGCINLDPPAGLVVPSAGERRMTS